MANKIKRSQIKSYLNVAPESPAILGSLLAVYALIGEGVVDIAIEYNPKTSESTELAQDSATSEVESYAPKIPVEQIAFLGDEVFDFIDALRLDRAILGDAETDIVNIWEYETGGPTAVPAEQQKVAIAVESIGDEGGKPVKLNYTIYFVGAPVIGTFNTTTKVFTAAGA